VDEVSLRRNQVSNSTKHSAIELFAGVGGFRLGLQDEWDVVWSNQWEPSTKTQHASEVYVKRFKPGDQHSCENIDDVLVKVENGELHIPPHQLLVAGFPCQDYSVARVLGQASGLVGKKGVLWWSIYELAKRYQPKYILLENVDRLLKSPATHRGRDFAIILSSLAGLGYTVEWRMVNSADYGFPQKRQRVFIIAEFNADKLNGEEKPQFISSEGVLAQAFPIHPPNTDMSFPITLKKDLVEVTETFSDPNTKESPFRNAGVMQDYEVITFGVNPLFDGVHAQKTYNEAEKGTLGSILQAEDQVDPRFVIPESQIDDWALLKGGTGEGKRSAKRIHKVSGVEYNYSEGAIPFPDPREKRSRTIVTGEGGSGPSRFKHVVEVNDRHRRLTPIELERLNGFDDDWTAVPGFSDSRRAFLMGNALVVGVVARISKPLAEKLAKTQNGYQNGDG